MKHFFFSKKKRLVSNSQFESVLARNVRVANGLLVLYAAENECGYPRLGVSVGKSCGGAVVRNRLKRLLRAVFQQSQDQIPADFDYVLMISHQWSKKLNNSMKSQEVLGQLKFEQLKTSFLTLAAAAVEKIG